MSEKLKGIKTFKLDFETDIHLYQAYISSINWMMGKNMLSNIEVEILSYFLYYNNKYSAIEDLDVRFELLFSSTTKHKIRNEFNINTQKLEGYLNKLRKKGVINDNKISDIFMVQPNKVSSILFSFSVKQVNAPKPPVVEEEMEINYKPMPYNYPVEEEEEEYEEDEQD